MITLRLDPDLENDVRVAARNLGLTKSELIRKSIIEYIGKLESLDAWESGKDLFGRYSSGRENLSVDRKAILKEKIRGKRK
ncbi:ribbon-helix-helix protein, CopG family [Desulfococcus multivorans]|uniref:CopG-like domain-containing protein DNA-binding protein n=1 Tax=Desulfococcus multivorans DSM 2059 TaxID=1121405 RepID=S7UPU9_DESML|nr:ribbon-helix-helix protein, CopG family [Desulfococcus multivorans]AQV02218.1 CopG family transcriptional regulator [Desulfococcus multivorans]EPR36074.1 CopG-like domain-containing protein DNA-binding protein [Desulfococcus multivorans DSM 2059]SJZ37981.1 Ribbon-helix-helix protein, copG family [Desulfococcus multivorans DSM 2059]